MANQKISGMPAANPLDGTELMEVVQGGVNKHTTTSSVMQTSVHETLEPAAGTITDFALPGTQNYVYDIDTTAGNVLINGIVAQRDGQEVTFGNTGANQLQLGVGAGSLGNEIRANAGPLGILPNDNLTIRYVEAILRWIVK